MKNLKSLILNGVTFLFSVLFLVFMSQQHIVWGENSIGNGYNYIRFDSPDGKYVALAVGLLLATIVACILILTSIYGVLRCFDVIKSNPADKVVKIVNIVSVVIGMIMMALAFIMDICVVADFNNTLLGTVEKASSGWAVGVNFTLYVFTTIAVCLDCFGKKAK